MGRPVATSSMMIFQLVFFSSHLWKPVLARVQLQASLFNVALPIIWAPCGACPHKLLAAALVALPQQVHKPVHDNLCQIQANFSCANF